MRKLRAFIPPLSFLLTTAVLAAVLVRQTPPAAFQSDLEISSDIGRPRSTESTELIFLPEPTDYSQHLVQVAERPLFSETRRNPVAQAPAPVEPAYVEEVVEEVAPDPMVAAAPNLTLLGYMQTAEVLSVLISSDLVAEEVWVKVGDYLGEWQVVDVAPSQVSIEKAGQRFVFE